MNAFYFINAYLVVARWFGWSDVARNFTHLVKINRPMPRKWEYSLSSKRKKFFLASPNNSHPGPRSTFAYVKLPANHSFVPSTNWVTGKVSMDSVGTLTIPQRDLDKLAPLSYPTEELSVRDTLRAAGLIYPFDRDWSEEDRARMRSRLGTEMAFRMMGASSREKLMQKKLEKKELGPLESFQAEILAQTDPIDAMFPPPSRVVQPGAMAAEIETQPEIEVTSAASDLAHQLDAQSSYDTIEAEIDAVPVTEDPALASATLPSPPLTRTRRLKKLSEVARDDAPKKLMGDAMAAAVPKKKSSDAMKAVASKTGILKRKVIPKPIVIPDKATETTEITSQKRKASHSPVREEIATEEVPLIAEPLAMRFPVSGRIIHRPEPTDSSETVSTEMPDPRGHAQAIDLTQSPVQENEPPRDQSVDLNEPAPQNPESDQEETAPPPAPQDKGKAPAVEGGETLPKIFLAEGARPLSGAGESSRPQGDESYDPEKPTDWPYDEPLVASLAAFSFAGFAGFHKHPVPPVDELKRIMEEIGDYPLLTLQHPAQCNERDLAVLFDTSVKMVLNTGMEIFHRHRNWSSQQTEALNEGYAIGRKEMEEVLTNTAIDVLRLKREATEREEEMKKSAEALAAFQTRISELEKTLSESQQEALTAREECEAVRKENSTHQSRIEILEAEKLALSNQLAARNTAFIALQEELETLKQDRDLAWMNADDYADQVDGAMEELEDTETFLGAENESLKSDVERLKAEVDSLDKQFAATQQEAIQNRSRDRMEGAKDFRSSPVFKNLVSHLSCPLGFQFWENCIGQTSHVGGFKDDFDPDTHLDPGCDSEFREYGDSGGLTFEEDDEFAPLQYNEDLDQDLIPKGEPEGEPKLPHYPPKTQDPSPAEETADQPPQP